MLGERKPAHPLVEAFFKEVEGFSIKEAAEKSGLARDTIIHWRTGRRRSPKLEEFDYLLQALGYELTFRSVSASEEAEIHPDDIAVDLFAAAMKAKLAKKRQEGRGGWNDKSQCSDKWLSHLLRKHVEKGDPLDVGNLAMMLHQRNERIV